MALQLPRFQRKPRAGHCCSQYHFAQPSIRKISLTRLYDAGAKCNRSDLGKLIVLLRNFAKGSLNIDQCKFNEAGTELIQWADKMRLPPSVIPPAIALHRSAAQSYAFLQRQQDYKIASALIFAAMNLSMAYNQSEPEVLTRLKSIP
ncbi:hypothetical protein K470DRAFT_259217 [Piedraia hortae CBS 480.64]|uniref:Uncharacterized protein n=1 Tax=Piedraia hortae CBS 480.64 TaxID=1314780 RepID=A0A6A7BV79_9PEZI|nr:hypothetical protein K470DRAFT_259217 [Piedraia hortae CBS 480.64]